MGQANITLPIFLVFLVASSALSDYPPKNPDMILGDKLDSLPHSRLGEARSPWLLRVQSDLPEPTLSMLVGGKGDEDAGLGFLEQPLLPSTAIEANGGAAGSGGNGESNLGSKKVLRSLVMIMLILLMIVGELGVLPSRKETRAIDSWATMSFHHLSFKEYDILQCLEGSPEQHPKVVVLGRVDKGNGRGSGTGQDGTKRFAKGGSNGEEEEESGRGSASVGRYEGGGGEGEGEGGETGGGVGGGRGRGGGGGGGGGGDGDGDGDEEGGGGGGGDGGGGGGGGDVEGRGGGRNRRPPVAAMMSITVAAQTSATVIVFHFTGKSCSNKVFLVCVVVGNLVGYLCSIAAVLLTHRKPRIAGVFGRIGSAAAATGFLLMIAMFLPSYLVWIVGIACVALFFVVTLAFKS
ncbi:uncharacterized protein LOC126703780 [Quercus robur]|uniref:uncharacterized protein LOC126703780 n=1 Tax=Quercus robur TaxID=38942 RepID=UPI002161137C|nr:uncharacterized protein LOC126703780 [Quercus robur]